MLSLRKICAAGRMLVTRPSRVALCAASLAVLTGTGDCSVRVIECVVVRFERPIHK